MFHLININLSDREFEFITVGLSLIPLTENEISKDLMFIKLNSLNLENRWTLRRAINKNTEAKIVLISAFNEISRFAWKLNAFHYLSFPLTESQLYSLKHKIILSSNDKNGDPKLKMNFKGGFKIIEPTDINIIKGQGSYCDFYIVNEKPEIFTARINDLHSSFVTSPFLKKINKSLIININNLTKIENGFAYFKGDSKV